MNSKRPTSAVMLFATLGGLFAGSMTFPQGPVGDPQLRAAASAKSDVQKNSPQRLAQLNQMVAAIGGWHRGSGRKRMPGTGWPVATDRRRAKKAKNAARNRAAHR